MKKNITPLGYYDRFTGFSNISPGRKQTRNYGKTLLIGILAVAAVSLALI